tara:strand:+ start:6222 stop:7229 length:1008 start_codon:yes stop_codon:yes gene_type:complete
MKKRKNKVLLISPSFFGYRKYISASMKENLYSVLTLNDVLPFYSYFNFIRKKKFFKNNLFSFMPNTFYKFYYYIFKPTHLFIILGRNVTEEVVLFYKSKNVKVTLYMWDSIANYPQSLKLSVLVDDFSSFDESDCKNYGARFVPLFYVDTIFNNLNIERDLSLLFVGSVHSDRLKILSKLKVVFDKSNIAVFFYLFLKNRSLYLKSKFIDKKYFYGFKYSDFTFKSMSLDEISAMYSTSSCVLDIQNSNQSGYTIRTLEALASGCKLITTNSSILSSNLYSTERVLIIGRDVDFDIDRLVSFVSTKPIYNSDYESIIYDYSLKSWLKKLGFAGEL